MNEFEFSVSAHQTQFLWAGAGVSITTAAGYDDILKKIVTSGQLSAYELEMMIYLTEEIIEADNRIMPVNGNAVSHDELLYALSNRYFDGASLITDTAIESVFNRLADSISYTACAYTPEELTQIAYLVFIREMAHHLSIQAISMKTGEMLIDPLLNQKNAISRS